MLITETTSRTICPLPFLHTYITANGSLVACCESQETILGSPSDTFKNNWNNDAYRNLRKSLIDGEQPQACTKCWDNEKLGILSNRQEAWSSFTKGFYGKKEIDTDDGLKIEQLPLAVELKCSNLCNLKCRMCHPESSHRISEDKEIIEKYRKGLPWPKNILSSQQTVQSLLSEGADYLSQIEVLQFSGGEPLISDEQYDLVQYLLKHNPEKVHLRYATNLTQLNYKSFDYPEVWKQFKRVNIKVSIDGIDDVYDYIRVGSSFNKVITNLYRLIDLNLPNVHLGIGFTTQAYNVFQLPEFLSFFEKLVPRNAITIYPLHAPKMMMISEIAPQYRERILHKLKSQRSDLEPIINIIKQSNADSSSWNQLLKYTDELEKKWHVKNGFQHLLEKYLEGY